MNIGIIRRFLGGILLCLLANCSFGQLTLTISKDTGAGATTGNDLINVKSVITNTGSEEVCFISMSCNGIDYMWQDTHEIKAEIFIHCNASHPHPVRLMPDSSATFHTFFRSTALSTDGLCLQIERVDCNIETGKHGHVYLDSFSSEKQILKSNALQLK